MSPSREAHPVHGPAHHVPLGAGAKLYRPVSIHSHIALREEEGARVAIVDRRWSALPVPYAMEFPDRARKERYFDPDFYQMEVELLWPRVWQMACRLEEIPQPRDFVEYEILDQSIVVVRNDDLGVRAFQNACRHRGVRVVEGRGTCESGFICPFHGWCYGLDGTNTFVPQAKTFAEHNLQPDDLEPHAGAVRGVGRVCVDQPRRRGSAACGSASSRSPPSSTRGRWSRCGPSGGTPAVSR